MKLYLPTAIRVERVYSTDAKRRSYFVVLVPELNLQSLMVEGYFAKLDLDEMCLAKFN